MAKVPQAMSTIWQITQIPPISQPRDRDRKLRSDLSGSFPAFDTELNSPSRNIARGICLVFTKVVMRIVATHAMACLPWPWTFAVRHLMTLSIAKGKHPLAAFLSVMAASLAILALLPPIPQDPSYHQFADQRTLLGIPNFWNVIST